MLDLDRLFSHHPPNLDQISRYKQIREAAAQLASVIDDCCPDGADKSAAIRKVREAVMTANAAIACGEAPTP